MGKLFYIMGKSATGKDHIYARLISDEKLGLKKLILYTTRPMRDGEKDGREYFFVDETALRDFEKSGKVIEERAYHTVHGIWTYFTVDDGQMDLSKNSYLGIGTLESYRKLKDWYGASVVVPIYLEVEDGERLSRALLREKSQDVPKYAEMCRRYLADEEDFSEKEISGAGILRRFQNIDLEACTREIAEVILREF